MREESSTLRWPLGPVMALAVSIVLGVAGQLLMKWAALRTVGAPTDWSALPPLAFALAVYSAGVVSWVFALRHLPLSVAYPLTSLNYIGILAGSYYWFGEHISILRALGVTCIFGGVLLVALGGNRLRAPIHGESSRPARAPR